MTDDDFATADLCDAHPTVAVCEPGLSSWGLRPAISGPIATVIAPEDNTLVRVALEEPGRGRVLVVDGLGSLRCALVGDNLATLAIDHGWAGIIVNGCIRDSAVIDAMDVGIWALGTHPRKSLKADQGRRDVPVEFLGARFTPGWWCGADADGVVVSPEPLR